MKTIVKQVEVPFHKLEFIDKVVMLPIMDKLALSVMTEEDLSIKTETDDFPIIVSAGKSERILKVLSDLGCRTSLGESYEDVIKSCNLQKENQECHTTQTESKKHTLQLLSFGHSKLETVKILKDSLLLGLKEAKDLVDSCPTDINLRKYQMKEAEYEWFLDLLRRKGCVCNLI